MDPEDEFSPEVLKAFEEAEALPIPNLEPPEHFVMVRYPGESDEDVRARQEVLNTLFGQPRGFPERL